MRKSYRYILRTGTILVGISTILFSFSCINRPMKVADPEPEIISDFSALQGVTRNVDLLFVIDNSLSMKQEQDRLKEQFSNLMRVLGEIKGGLPNIHVGVISTDIGTSIYPGCPVQGGDNGRLRKGENDSCVNPVNQAYIVDVEPAGCEIEHDPVNEDICSFTNCSQANCAPVAFTDAGQSAEPDGLQYFVDDNGCPRCRNYDNEPLEEVFSCTAELGTRGCGFEQPFESMYKSITESNPENQGFYRDDAYLAILFISDEDDCSASNGIIFSEPDASVEDTLGIFSSFRCTEFGIKCDEPWQRIMPQGVAQYTNCSSRTDDDPHSLLFPISRYTGLLNQFKDPQMIISAAIAGPFDGNLTVQTGDKQEPELSDVCGDAVSAVRLKEFTENYNSVDDMLWAYTSICSNDYSPALVGIGKKIKNMVEVQCITTPLNGCPDPSFANGGDKITSLSDEEASLCEPHCTVVDVLPGMVIEDIPLCPSTYKNGHPPKRDTDLPIPKCYHVTYNAKCDFGVNHSPSRGAEIIISRRTSPVLGTSAKITCRGLPLLEKLCHDGIDNDADGRIDDQDSDCTNGITYNNPL